MNNSNWNICFEQFNAMSAPAREALRGCASDHLVKQGAEEVGSSDVNHELYAMWCNADRNWHGVMLNEINLIFINESKD